MRLIIDIDESLYNAINQDIYINGMRSGKTILQKLVTSIANGTPIHNVTNGDIVMAFFPNEHDFETDFDAAWWNAPYQKGGKE